MNLLTLKTTRAIIEAELRSISDFYKGREIGNCCIEFRKNCSNLITELASQSQI